MRGRCLLKWPPDLRAGEIVEHKSRPGSPFVVVSGPHEGLWGEKYMVKGPDGKVVPVLKSNLIF